MRTLITILAIITLSFSGCGGDGEDNGDPPANGGANNSTSDNADNGDNGDNADNNGTNNRPPATVGNAVEDAGEGETGGLCPIECSAPIVPVVIPCDGCAEDRCHYVDPFSPYCTRACDDNADCADLGTDWSCQEGSCILD